MSLHPREAKDLALAPVAIHIDENLRPFRACAPEELEATFQLALDQPALDDTRESREERILKAALHTVDLHGWEAAITPDGSAVRLSGGSVSIDIALGATLLHHLEEAGAPGPRHSPS